MENLTKPALAGQPGGDSGTDTGAAIMADDRRAIQRLDELFIQQKRAFRADMLPGYHERLDRLKRLEAMLLDHQREIIEAVDADFGCHPAPLTRITEIMPAVLRIRYARKHLKRWMRSRSRPINRLMFGGGSNSVRYQPLGVIGNMAPWNFPFDITLGPLTDILAAGNHVMIKPSEASPISAALLQRLVERYFAADLVAVIPGGPEVARAFSAKAWDHLLFTGGPEIGARVMAAASKNLTPVTLELGGKCPVIITEDRLTPDVVTNILAAKLIKSGQMCIGVDYVLVPESGMDRFVEYSRQAMRELYPTITRNGDYTAIINRRHFDRLSGYLADARAKGAAVVELNPAGESPDPDARKLPPSLVLDPGDDLEVMRHEIFGPILPVKPYREIQAAVDFINDGHRPLALYVFSGSKKVQRYVLDNTISGGVCLNAVGVHALQPSLPFGGVGRSGMGEHHGFEGFRTFSKARPIFRQARFHATSLLFPPYRPLLDLFLNFAIGRAPGKI